MSGMLITFILVSVLLPLFLDEIRDIGPWAARRLLRWGARRLGSQDKAERYLEEWLADLQCVPGKLMQLGYACGVILSAVPRLRRQFRQDRPTKHVTPDLPRSPGGRFRAALLRAGLVMVSVGAVFGIETSVAAAFGGADNPLGGLTLCLPAGLLAVIEVAARPRIPSGLAGGFSLVLTMTLLTTFIGEEFGLGLAVGLGGGVAFGLATALIRAFTARFMRFGEYLGGMLNISAMGALVPLISWSMNSRDTVLEIITMYVVLGFAAGCLTGLAVTFAAARRNSRADLIANPPTAQPSTMAD